MCWAQSWESFFDCFPRQWIIQSLRLQETTKRSELPICFLGDRFPIDGGRKQVKEDFVVLMRRREISYIPP
jgi:hypothetical protein